MKSNKLLTLGVCAVMLAQITAPTAKVLAETLPSASEEVVIEVPEAEPTQVSEEAPVLEETPVPEETQATEEVPASDVAETPVVEEVPAVDEKPSLGEKSEASDITAAKAALQGAIDNALAKLASANYPGEEAKKVRDKIALAKTLLGNINATIGELNAMVSELNILVAGLVGLEEPNLTVFSNLEHAIDAGLGALNLEEDSEFYSFYTLASVEMMREELEKLVGEGLELHRSILNAYFTQSGMAAPVIKDYPGYLTQEAVIQAKADQILNLLNNGTLVETQPIMTALEMFLEIIESLEGSFITPGFEQDEEVLFTAFFDLADLLETATTQEQVDAAIAKVQKALDSFHLSVFVTAVDEDGNRIADDRSVDGLYKGDYSVDPASIEGYEFVSSYISETSVGVAEELLEESDRLDGTFGDGINEITMVYKAIDGSSTPESPIKEEKPAKTVVLQPVKLPKTNGKQVKAEELTKTNVSMGILPASSGLVAAIGSIAAFLKNRKKNK